VIAVILAAGISSRLRPLTNETPKCLLRVGATPLLQRILHSLHRNNIRECVIVTGYCKEKIEDFVQSLSLPITVLFAENPLYATTGNNYSLWSAHAYVGEHDMLVLDGDILFDSRLLALLIHSPHKNGLIIRKTGHLGAEEIKVEVDESGFVTRIGKEIDLTAAAGESIGIEKFSADTTKILFDTLNRRKDRNEFYEASFQEMIDGGAEVHAIDSSGLPCMEIDTLEDLTAANELAQMIP
jgi:choline kinase